MSNRKLGNGSETRAVDRAGRPYADTFYTCSVCKNDFYIEAVGDTLKDLFLYSYCPECGARMDGNNNADNR